jgi:condensin complex subunit 3
LGRDVRKTVLGQLEITQDVLPLVVERTRDVDPTVRRLVYRKVLADVPDFRVFSIAERELILRHGLYDRYASLSLKRCEYQ